MEPRYEVFKGYELIAAGTLKECAEKLGVKENSIKFYASELYWRRQENLENATTAIRVN